MIALLLSVAFAAKVDASILAQLDDAQAHPEKKPPELVYDGSHNATLDKGEPVYDFQHFKGHDVAAASITTWATVEDVWKAIYGVNRYPEYIDGLKRAHLDKEKDSAKVDELDVTIDLKIPSGLPGHIELQGFHYNDGGYMAFHQESGSRTPFKHMFGYWIVKKRGDKTLIQLLVDVKTGVPLLVKQREKIGKVVLPHVIGSIRQYSEINAYERLGKPVPRLTPP